MPFPNSQENISYSNPYSFLSQIYHVPRVNQDSCFNHLKYEVSFNDFLSCFLLLLLFGDEVFSSRGMETLMIESCLSLPLYGLVSSAFCW